MPQPKLKRLYVEITNACNLHCSFCTPCHRPPRLMSPEEFASIIKQATPFAPHIYLHVKGEPLLHPQLEEILAICSKARLPVNLTTNGTLLKKQQQLLLQSPALRKINLSVHSLEEGSAVDQREYLTNLAQFGLAAADAGSPIVTYRMWNGEEGGAVSEAALAQLQALAQPFGKALAAALPKGRNAAKLADNVYISFEEQFQWPSLDLPLAAKRGKCLGGREMLAVLVDGTVVPCCLDADGVIALGNLFQQPLDDIVESPRYVALAAGFCGGNISEELCRRCSYRLRFDKSKKSVKTP